MADRASLNQIVQLGVESSPGAGGTITKKLSSLNILPNLGLQIDKFRGAGSKYQSLTSLSKEWSTGAVSGRATYNEIIYPLASIVNAPVTTTPSGGTLSRQHVFTSSTYADDTPKTYAIEHGSSVRASAFDYGLFTEFGMRISRQAVELTGAMVGKAITDDITLTSSGVTQLDLIPILPGQFSVYIDDTAAALGTTKMLRALSANFTLSNRYSVIWVLDAAESSFVGHIEVEPTLSLNLMLEADDQGMDLLTRLQEGAKAFVRVEAVGGLIEGTIHNKFTLDFCGEVEATDGYSDQEGLFAVGWTLTGVHDNTWSKAFQAKVVNSLTGL